MEVLFPIVTVQMEFPVFSSFQTVSKVSFCPFSSKQNCHRCFFSRRKLRVKWSCNSKSLVRLTMSAEKDSSSNGNGGRENGGTKSGSGFIEVIGIGSRKDAVFDFCLNSPFQLSSLRFWNIIMKESQEVQLQLRSAKEEPHPRIVKVPQFTNSCSNIILVASAGYGLDHNAAVDILEAIRSASGLTVAVVLKPFSFEGLRRQDEVKALIGKLKENTGLLIEIDIDALLKKDLVTLDEAVKTANTAVLLVINAISVLAFENHRKLLNGLHEGIEEVSVSEINKILGCYKEARIGFGAAYNIKTSILQSIFDCPFLGVGLKDTNSIIICIVASSVPMNDSDIVAFLCTFRKATEYTREIIISTIHEPNLEPNLLVTTVLTLGSLNVQQSSQRGGILSRLAQHFPLFFSLWGRQHQQPTDNRKDNAVEMSCPSDVIGSYDFEEGTNRIARDVIDDNFGNYVEVLEPELCGNSTNLYASRNSEQNEEELFDSIAEDSSFYDAIAGGDSAFQREQLVNWNLGPGFEVAQEWAKERAADATPMIDNLSIFQLPVGVRPSEELEDCSKATFMIQHQEPETENNVKAPIIGGMPSWSALTDAGLEAMMEIASSFLNGKYTDKSKKQGVLSVRAASMLETERDCSKKWIPIVEMQYRGGMYKGRCQGGLPEGKGRLVLGDGSIYDGLWRYGKRSGPGIFYFKNGDVFQGSWRDDVIHGKGWFYFHTGDRWFANFWKGKANGEGRFYTKTGDAIFGNFKDGWRDGKFLCISANGTKYVEIWEQGVLLDSKRINEDAKDR